MIDLSKIRKFFRKSYRDSYLEFAVHGGIAYQIRALRERAGLTQAEFAEKIGTKQSVISRLENAEYGRVSVSTLLKIAFALNIALIVRFASYPEFLMRMTDVTPKGLQAETIYESLEHLSQPPRELPQLSSALPNHVAVVYRTPLEMSQYDATAARAPTLIPNFANRIRYMERTQLATQTAILGDPALQRQSPFGDLVQQEQRQMVSASSEVQSSFISQQNVS